MTLDPPMSHAGSERRDETGAGSMYQEPAPDAPVPVEATYAAERFAPPASRSVAELLADDTDPRAWDQLVERYAGLVWSVARSFRLDDATAADVTQQAWLSLVEHRHDVRDPERLGGWLATTTRRAAIRAVHRRDAERPSESVGAELDAHEPFGDIGAELEEAETRAEVRRAFGLLPESCQLLLRLCLVEPRIEYVVIAELVGRPVGSLGPTRRRCLDRLRTRLSESVSEAP